MVLALRDGRSAAVLAALVAIGGTAYTLTQELWRRRAFDGLDSVVSFSSRLIAAARAVETERDDAYVRDPLAALLAGRQAMQKALQRVAEQRKASGNDTGAEATEQHQQQKEQQQEQQQQRQGDGAGEAHVSSSSNVLNASDEPVASETSETAVASPQRTKRAIGRIVFRTVFFDDAVLTATGAFLPDLTDKQVPAMFKALQAAQGGRTCTQVVLLGSGMDSRPWRLDLPQGVSWFEVDRADVLTTKTRLLKRAGATMESANSQKAKYPLRCAKWDGVSLDLEQPGWTQKLLSAGFCVEKPTIWVLEGLLYYLQPDTVPLMLKEAASVSAAGSALVASICNAEFIEVLRSRGVYNNPDNIMSGWKWGCPEEPGKYFGDNGWRVLSNPIWTEACSVYGLQPDNRGRKGIQAGAEAGSKASQIRYVTAVLPASPGAK